MKSTPLRKALVLSLICSVSFASALVSNVAISHAKKSGDQRVIENAIQDAAKKTALHEEDPQEAIEEMVEDLPAEVVDELLDQNIKEIEIAEPAVTPPEEPAAPAEETAADTTDIVEPALEAEPAEIAEASTEIEEKPKRIRGIRTGAYIISPRLSIQGHHVDNVLYTAANEGDDIVTIAKPGLSIHTKEDYEHALNLDAEFEYLRYSENDDESHNNFNLTIDAHIAKNEAFSIPFFLSYEQSHEDRMDDLTGQRPVERLEIAKFYTSTGFRFKDGPFTAEIRGHFGENRFDDEEDANGNAVVRRDADHDVVSTSADLHWDINDHHRVSLLGLWGDKDYDQNSFQGGGFNGPNRSSDHTHIFAGWKMKYKGFTSKLKAGFGMLDFEEDAVLSDINTAIGSAEISWNISKWLDMALNYRRDIHEDEEVIQGIIRDRGDLSFGVKMGDHVKWQLGGLFEKWSFEESTRDDRYIGFDTSLDYFFNDFVALGASYEMLKRSSDADGLDFDNNTIMLHLSGRM